MTAIVTRFLGPTNFRGARYKAIAGEGGKGFELTVAQDYSIGSNENHERAARLLIEKLGWFHETQRGDRYADWYCGSLPTGYAFVCAVDYARVKRTTND